MRIKKHDLLDLFIIFAAIGLALINDISSYELKWPTFSFLTIGFLFILRDFSSHGPFGAVLLVGGIVLYTFPYFGQCLSGDGVSFIYYSLYLLVVVILTRFNPSPYCCYPADAQRNWFFFMVVALLISASGLFIWKPIYEGFYALALFFLARSCRSAFLSNKNLVFQTAPFYLLLLYYYFFVWSGFGRLHFLVYLLLPVLVLSYHKRLVLKAWCFVAMAPVGLILGFAMRSNSGLERRVGVEDVVGGSVSHHLLLMERLYLSIGSRDWRLIELYDQYVLYFLNWFPRDVWVDKPVGIGLWFVDEYLGRVGHSNGHNVSLGLWGEHIYLLPELWFVSGLLSVFLTGLVFKLLYKISLKSGVVVLIFQVSLLSFFWGGMASFGSRVWWMVLPVLLYIWFDKLVSDVLSTTKPV